jgi:D-alanyl-D-alanine carboxypeptidase/D-alanyl-D-alanine-endopeptidase (penicillin-binding protein 4)
LAYFAIGHSSFDILRFKCAERPMILRDLLSGFILNQCRSLRFFALLAMFFLVPSGTPLIAAQQQGSRPLVGERDAAILIDPHGRILFSRNVDTPLIPASTLKIFTALVALHHLGPAYRFPTEFYIDDSANLKIRGYGDPLLISEVVAEIAGKLRESHNPETRIINDIIVDASFFSRPLTIPGVSSSSEPYDAPNGALCVNFNTISFARNEGGATISAEPQTPLLSYGLHRVKASGLETGRIVLSNNGNETTLYAGHLFRYFLEKSGVTIKGGIRTGTVKKGADRLIFRYVSGYALKDVIARLLQYSNNFVANQLLIATGAEVSGSPGTLTKGADAATAYAKNLRGINTLRLVEGSGISRDNRISARDMARVLDRFVPYAHLLQKTGREFYKTGTLRGIHTRAGYIEDGKGELYRFVVFVNTPGKPVTGIMERIRERAMSYDGMK